MEYRHHHNTRRLSKQAESNAALCMKNLTHWASAVREVQPWPEYHPQPLRALPGLAKKLGRGMRPSPADLRAAKYRNITQRVPVCVATDGNQGRGHAYGAKYFGCRCIAYIDGHVSDGRAEAIKELAAVVISIDGEYEASVARAKEDARMNGWYFVSSTSCSDFDNDMTQHVMNAYIYGCS